MKTPTPTPTRQAFLQKSALAGAAVAATGALGTLGTASAAVIRQPATVRLTAWWGGLAVAQHPAVLQLVSRFEAQHPTIKIDSSFFPTWDEMRQKTLTAMAAGTPPDVFRISVFDVGMFASRNSLLELDPFIKNDHTYAPAAFLPACWQNVVYNGKVYALPWNYSAVALLYNPTLFARVGLKRPPTTWDELRAYAIKLTDAKSKQYGFLDVYTSSADDMNFFGPLLFSTGAHLFNSDDPGKATKATFGSRQGVAALSFLTDLANKYHATTPPGGSTPNVELTGRIGMWLTGQWAITNYAKNAPSFRYKVAMLPASPFARGTTVAGGNQIGVAAATKYPEEAVTFIKYVQSQAQDLTFARAGGYLPARVANYEAPYLNAEPWRTFAEQGKYARNRTAVKNAQHILVDLMQQVQAAQLGQMTPAQAMATAQAQANSLL